MASKISFLLLLSFFSLFSLTSSQLLSSQIRFISTLSEVSTYSLSSGSTSIVTYHGGIGASDFQQFSYNGPPEVQVSFQAIEVTTNFTSGSAWVSIILYKSGTYFLAVKYEDFSYIKGSDLARWSIINLSSKIPKLSSQNSDCYKCLAFQMGTVQSVSAQDFTLYLNKTVHQFYIYLEADDSETQVFHLDINEKGVYTYLLFDSDSSSHPFELVEIIDQEPNQVWIPLVVAFFILLGICLLRLLFNYLYEKYQKSKERENMRELDQFQPLNGEKKAEGQKKMGNFRVESLDAFRGISLAIMIFVNFGGGNYWFFNHSTWNGLTVADLVFPWFIWIMGTSMALSFDKLQKTKPKDFSHLDFIYKIVRRFVILFLLGMFVNNGYDLYNWRIPGVLQRFAVGYLLIALITSYIPKLDVQTLKPLKDILDYSLQWAVVLCVLLAYLLITYLSEVNGCPKGYTGPGGAADYGMYVNCTGGVALYLDRKVFGWHHIYHEPTCKDVYMTGDFDPEGFLGNFTSLVLTFTGYQCGRILINYKNDKDKLIRWVIWGLVMAAIGTGLCGASINEGIVPLNKNLWSVSFILLLGGLAFLCIALCYFIVDIKKWWYGWPFIYVGRNSIAIYMGHELLQTYFPLSFNNDGNHTLMLVSNLIGVCSCLWVAWKLNEEGVFIKV